MGKELPRVWYEMPLFWKGNPNSVIGQDDDIPWPRYSTLMDFELEIAAVIGKKAINRDPSDAEECIYGFTIFNDVSARDRQRREVEFMLGPAKGKDFCNIFGPVLVTRDEIDPYNLKVQTSVNGEVWAKSETSGMQHTWSALVSHISEDEWLYPGDVLTSGTVTGCTASEYLISKGSLRKDEIMRPGDLVELEVEGIGVLRNRFGEPRRSEG
jgi:2-keto-4-pentenoate hydratase/2-oxohepta-3-ene-1,7-dioic acid hydratase in catechol pathway